MVAKFFWAIWTVQLVEAKSKPALYFWRRNLILFTSETHKHEKNSREVTVWRRSLFISVDAGIAPRSVENCCQRFLRCARVKLTKEANPSCARMAGMVLLDWSWKDEVLAPVEAEGLTGGLCQEGPGVWNKFRIPMIFMHGRGLGEWCTIRAYFSWTCFL